jgi:hypothetical protein
MYRDTQGQAHLVDKQAQVPTDARAIKRIRLPRTAGSEGQAAATAKEFGAHALETLRGAIHEAASGPAAGAGTAVGSPGGARHAAHGSLLKAPVWPVAVGVALLVFLALRRPGLRGIVFKVVLSAVGVAAAGSGYIRLMSHGTGAKNGPVTPAGIIQQAQDTATTMQKQMQKEQQALDGLEK